MTPKKKNFIWCNQIRAVTAHSAFQGSFIIQLGNHCNNFTARVSQARAPPIISVMLQSLIYLNYKSQPFYLNQAANDALLQVATVEVGDILKAGVGVSSCINYMWGLIRFVLISISLCVLNFI